MNEVRNDVSSFVSSLFRCHKYTIYVMHETFENILVMSQDLQDTAMNVLFDRHICLVFIIFIPSTT